MLDGLEIKIEIVIRFSESKKMAIYNLKSAKSDIWTFFINGYWPHSSQGYFFGVILLANLLTLKLIIGTFDSFVP